MGNELHMHAHSTVEGWYRVQKSYPGKKPHYDSGFFPNLITNLGLDQIGNNVNGQLFVQVGTGNAAPAFTNTQLSNYLASQGGAVVTTGVNNVTGNYYGWRRNVYTFAQGAAAGNLAELGVSSTATSGNLFSRALILDGGGSPTTLTVLANEILTVTYEYRMNIVTTDVASSINISGVTYATVTRPLEVTNPTYYANLLPNNWDGSNSNTKNVSSKEDATLVDATGSSSLYNQQIAATNIGYVAGNHYFERSHLVPIGNWNYTTGVGAIAYFSGMSVWQTNFTPKIPKDNTKTLTLVTRWSWARA